MRNAASESDASTFSISHSAFSISLAAPAHRDLRRPERAVAEGVALLQKLYDGRALAGVLRGVLLEQGFVVSGLERVARLRGDLLDLLTLKHAEPLVVNDL